MQMKNAYNVLQDGDMVEVVSNGGDMVEDIPSDGNMVEDIPSDGDMVEDGQSDASSDSPITLGPTDVAVELNHQITPVDATSAEN